jgi:uncharacterized protein YggE
MKRLLVAGVKLAMLTTVASAQARRPFARASGEGVVSVRPDQFEIAVGVVTVADTAQNAADRNAVELSRVIDALRRLLGQRAEIRTVGFSLSPNYRSQTGGQPPVIAAYTASNTVSANVQDLTMAGRVIDTAAQAGATTIHGLRFSLKNPQPARAEALRMATQQARANAEAIAQGLNARLGLVVMAEEGGSVRVITSDRAGAAAATPIEPGSVEVRALVTIEAEIAQ